jgi:hypothetical protein
MKGLIILAALMLIGSVLMFFCSYKLLSEINQVKAANPDKDATMLRTEMQPYVLGSYLGLALLAGGGLGAIILIFRSWSRRL